MPGKHLTKVVRHYSEFALIIAAIFLPQFLLAQTNIVSDPPQFLGSQSCSASSCHGGAGEKSKQYTIWSTHDFHHARPYATLETARSERLAEVLKLGNPAQSARCTVCHAPLATVSTERLGHDVSVTEGVSCETCHGPSENWIRSHTRPDYTHADRVASGMRDLHNLYVRANTCVACHQNIDPEIRAAGHPELIFEMDGQSVTMPRHWAKETADQSALAWRVGQFVALREMSWQLAQNRGGTSELSNSWSGLVWLEGYIWGADEILLPPPITSKNLAQVQSDADLYARSNAEGTMSLIQQTPEFTRKMLLRLASTPGDFRQKDVAREIHARRAERLVLALDRLTSAMGAASTNSAINQSLNKLFADAQSLPDFNPDQFANDLNTFHSSVAGYLETK